MQNQDLSIALGTVLTLNSLVQLKPVYQLNLDLWMNLSSEQAFFDIQKGWIGNLNHSLIRITSLDW